MNKLITRAAVVTAAAGAALALASAPAGAQVGDNFGAIAVSQSTGNTGWATDYASQGAAESAALGKCGAGDCQILVWVQNGCAAAAQAADTSWSSAYGPSQAAAESAALSAGNAGSRIITWVCTTR